MQTHANECTEPSLRHRRKWYLTGMMIPFLADEIMSWRMRDKSNSSAGKHENTYSHARTQSNHFRDRSAMNFTETL